ncbi:MAG: polysulfide reductase NrfD [Gammaproteobacteria bacterium]|nr:polysulfide reductase NrfD [Gammaproteobacteria bacterium]MBL7000926.1 polysulfide reductase NrfD [Gammaproteobacteria bacterium]
MKKLRYTSIDGKSSSFLALLGGLGFFILLGFIAFLQMEHEGHHITGMSNQVIWGLPHVFAIFLIVAASGALNVASIASVFNQKFYKPLAKLSAVLAIALLVGGLIVLLLDLGRPDRLIVAITYYNFKSIFTWNILLYTGFIGIVGVYLWTMMDWQVEKYTRIAGTAAFIWRLILTTGTGSIFGFLVSRQAYDAAIMAPMFVIMSFSFGLAIYLLVLLASYSWTGRELGDYVVNRLKNLLGVFIAATLYFTLAYHLTNLYATEHHGVEAYILLNGGAITAIFWIGQILLGSIVPLALLYCPRPARLRKMTGIASALVILGGFSTLYVILIGGQSFPMTLIPGYEATSTFSDGVIAQYSPSIWEFMLGMGGVAIALIIVTLALKIFRLIPESLDDNFAKPHQS